MWPGESGYCGRNYQPEPRANLLSRAQILQQAVAAPVAQVNPLPQGVLALLR